MTWAQKEVYSGHESDIFPVSVQGDHFRGATKGMVRTILALAALGLSIAGCGGSPRHDPPDTPEYHAIQDYQKIAGNANLLLSTDRINWVPGRTEPERVSVECRGRYCSVGYSAFLRSNKVIRVLPEELTILQDTNGIPTAIDYFSDPFGVLHSYGAWMEHSFFAATATMYTNDLDPDQGVVQTYGTVTGNTTNTNPEIEAVWTGFATARDHNIATDIESVVTGDARISVSIGESVTADVRLSGLANITTGQTYTDMVYNGMAVTEGQFSRYHADNNRLSGVFYGPNHEEVGGVFDHPQGLVGAFGGRKVPR